MDGENSKQSNESSGWQYKTSDAADSQQTNQLTENDEDRSDSDSQMLHQDDYLQSSDSKDAVPSATETISWTASEFIAHKKTISWYAILVFATLIVASAVFLITHDKISTFVILFVGIIFGIYAARKPRTIKLTVDHSGVTIGEHFYAYAQFRSFAMVEEGAFSSIVFMPLRRFMPLITVYYDPKDEQKITSILSDRIPLDTHKLDYVEQFMRRIRF